jgi:hypothetical protein
VSRFVHGRNWTALVEEADWRSYLVRKVSMRQTGAEQESNRPDPPRVSEICAMGPQTVEKAVGGGTAALP